MLDDLKLAWRRLRGAPGFAAVAILSLALAIGATTAIFSIADAVLFRSLGFANPGELDVILMGNRVTGSRSTRVGYEYLDALSANAASIGVSEVGFIQDAPSIRVDGPDGVESLRVMAASPSYLRVLGVRPIRGRIFDDAAAAAGGRSVMLTYDTWQRRFGGRADIVGHPLAMGSATYDVVGILPPEAVFPSVFGTKPELLATVPPPARGVRGGTFYPIVRRQNGLTREAVQPRIDAATAAVSALNPRTADLAPVLVDVRSRMFPAGRPIMRWLFAASILVLLLGCANLANMLLARSQRHERETALAMALGASRMRVIRPLMLESVIIGLTAAVVAVVTTSALFDTLLKQVPRVAYGPARIGVDLRVVLWTLAMGLIAGLIFAAVPAWRSTRRDVQAVLQARHAGGRRGGRLGRPMVVVQVALAVTLLFGAALTVRAFVELLRVPLGFSDTNVLRVSVATDGLEGAALQEHYAAIIRTLEARPDIAVAGAAGQHPFDGSAPDEGVALPGTETMPATIVHVLPGYLETIGVTPVHGRLLSWDDAASDPDAAVVSEGAARVLFPNQDPIGQIFNNSRARRFHVVGVVPDMTYALNAGRKDPPSTYVMPGASMRSLTLFAKARSKSDATLIAIKKDLARATPGAPVEVEWWSNAISGTATFKNPRFQTIVLSSFAVLALGLTALGIFGVVAFLVATRTREMGIRLAIGATPASLVQLVVRQSLLPVGLGIVAGVASARLLGKLAEAQLFQVRTDDPVTLAAAAATVLAAALLASWLPARHAARVDPIIVLKAE